MINKLVNEVTIESMDGNTQLEKELNAYLTKQFIAKKEIPSDECLSEAREVIKIVGGHVVRDATEQEQKIDCCSDRYHVYVSYVCSCGVLACHSCMKAHCFNLHYRQEA